MNEPSDSKPSTKQSLGDSAYRKRAEAPTQTNSAMNSKNSANTSSSSALKAYADMAMAKTQTNDAYRPGQSAPQTAESATGGAPWPLIIGAGIAVIMGVAIALFATGVL